MRHAESAITSFILIVYTYAPKKRKKIQLDVIHAAQVGLCTEMHFQIQYSFCKFVGFIYIRM